MWLALFFQTKARKLFLVAKILQSKNYKVTITSLHSIVLS